MQGRYTTKRRDEVRHATTRRRLTPRETRPNREDWDAYPIIDGGQGSSAEQTLNTGRVLIAAVVVALALYLFNQFLLRS